MPCSESILLPIMDAEDRPGFSYDIEGMGFDYALRRWRAMKLRLRAWTGGRLLLKLGLLSQGNGWGSGWPQGIASAAAGAIRRAINQREQAWVAAGVALALAAMLAGGLAGGWHRGQLVEIDRAPPLRQQFQLDMNQAGWAEWTLLPGVGETLARRIVESREQAGPFSRHEDLLRVRGIGPRTFDRLRGHLLPMAEASRSVP